MLDFRGSYDKIITSRNSVGSTISALTKSPKLEVIMAKNSLPKSKPLTKAQISESPEFFWRRVAITQDDTKCWDWQGAKGDGGYGTLRFRGKTHRSHRVAFELANGQPAKNLVLHSCDNRLCCNPNHLRNGTSADNVRDAITRHRFALGERHPNAKLTAQQITEIRDLFTQGLSNLEIARMYGLARVTINLIRVGRRWKSLK